MKLLESAPNRYDLGIHLLTLGRLRAVYDRLADHIEEGQKVVDLGCGTGALTLRAAGKGAKVKGIDVNPQMLEIARKRASETGLTERIDLCEMGVVELNGEQSENYDAVTAGLCFSELSEDELHYTLKEVARILMPGGLLLIADEVVPQCLAKRFLHSLVRLPLLVVTYLVTQSTTNAIKELPERIEGAGLVIESIRLNRMGSFAELVAMKPQKGPQ